MKLKLLLPMIMILLASMSVLAVCPSEGAFTTSTTLTENCEVGTGWDFGSNVELDCDGYTLSTNTSTTGNMLSMNLVSNVTIRNCVINDTNSVGREYANIIDLRNTTGIILQSLHFTNNTQLNATNSSARLVSALDSNNTFIDDLTIRNWSTNYAFGGVEMFDLVNVNGFNFTNSEIRDINQSNWESTNRGGIFRVRATSYNMKFDNNLFYNIDSGTISRGAVVDFQSGCDTVGVFCEYTNNNYYFPMLTVFTEGLASVNMDNWTITGNVNDPPYTNLAPVGNGIITPSPDEVVNGSTITIIANESTDEANETVVYAYNLYNKSTGLFVREVVDNVTYVNFAFTHSPYDNYTLEMVSCDNYTNPQCSLQTVNFTLNCQPSWSQQVTSCDDGYETVFYTDSNSCGKNEDLPLDNGTQQFCGTYQRQFADADPPRAIVDLLVTIIFALIGYSALIVIILLVRWVTKK